MAWSKPARWGAAAFLFLAVGGAAFYFGALAGQPDLPAGTVIELPSAHIATVDPSHLVDAAIFAPGARREQVEKIYGPHQVFVLRQGTRVKLLSRGSHSEHPAIDGATSFRVLVLDGPYAARELWILGGVIEKVHAAE